MDIVICIICHVNRTQTSVYCTWYVILSSTELPSYINETLLSLGIICYLNDSCIILGCKGASIRVDGALQEHLNDEEKKESPQSH